MKKINIKNELETWLIDYITNTIHGLRGEDFDDFNKWAKSFKDSHRDRFCLNLQIKEKDLVMGSGTWEWVPVPQR